MLRALFFSALLLHVFSGQLVHSLPSSELTSRSDVAEEILAGFTQGQEEFDDHDRDGDLQQNLVLLMGSSKTMADFFGYQSMEIVDLTTNVTILPHLMLNTRTKTGFLDLSTSGEDTNSTQLIPRIYFTKKIVNMVSAVKLLFLVDFPSFKAQMKGSLLEIVLPFLEKVAVTVKNIEKFIDSIGLIVTQIHNKQQIEEVKDYLKNDGYDDWNKLGFVPSVSSLKIYNNKKLDRVIYESIGFTSYDSNDFIYSPCQNTPDNCASLIHLLKQNLADTVGRIGQEMIEFYTLVEKQMHDIEKSYFYFLHVNQTFNAAKLWTKSIENPGQLIERIIEYSRDANVDLASKNLQLSANYAKYLVFLQGPDVPKGTYESLRDQLIPVTKYLDSSAQWYKLLTKIYRKNLSTFIVQQNITKYQKVTSQLLQNVQKVKGGKNINIAKNLERFSSLLPRPFTAKDLDILKTSLLNLPKLEALERVLSTTLMHNGPNVECNSKLKKLTISGSYVKSSDVSKSNCNNATLIEVLALYNVFFDEDLDLVGKKVHLAIIAPKWDVIGDRIIKLDGAAGKYHDEYRARNSLGPGNKGEDGKPGLPGGPAGNFLGIGRFFSDSENLYVSANGGKGGPGQYGGDGTGEDEGGKGGVHGLGGKPGTVTMIGLDESNPDIIVRARPGFQGEEVRGGRGKRTRNISFNSQGRKEPDALKPLPFYRSVNSYQCYLREHQISNLREAGLEKFSRLIADSEAVINLYDVVGLVDEFRGLEDQFLQLSPKMSLLPTYKSLLDQIKKYAKKLESSGKLYQDKINALRYLYTAVLSKIVNLENRVDTNLVVDLKTFLKAIKYDIDEVPELKDTHIINGYKRDYVHEFQAKSEEAQRYVTDTITPEINRICQSLDDKVLKLVNETVALEKAAEKEKKKLIEQQEKLKKSMILRIMFSVIEIGSLFLNFLGPIGTAVGAVIGGVAAVTEALVVDTSTVDPKGLLKLPAAVNQALPPLTNYFKSRQEQFSKQLSDANKAFKGLSEEEKSDIKDLENKITAAKKEYDEQTSKGHTYDPASVDSLYNKKKEIDDLSSQKIKALEAKKERVDDKVSKQLKVVNYVQNIVSIGDMSVKAYNEISADKSKIDETGKLIRQADEKIKKLKQFEQSIYKTILPVCRSIVVSVNQNLEGLKDQSSAALVVRQWQIQNALRNITNEIKRMTKGFQVQAEFSDVFNRVEEGINVVIKVYDAIDEYHYRAELGAFIADVNAHPSRAIAANNTDLSEKVNDLMLVIQNNVVMQDYKVAVNAIQQNVFPFADDFFRMYSLPSYLETKDTDALVSYASKQLDQLNYKLMISYATINNYDRFVHQNVIFSGRKGRSKPLYTWKYNEYRNNIKKLLNGQKVVLKADIRHGFKGNAVKFNRIFINFASPNKTIERKLRESLQDFRVTMVHMGFSYYRCDDKIYMIPSAHQTIEYSMSDYPGTTNLVYDKIANNWPILSPYTTWQIQLNRDEGADSDELSRYASEMIDLVLEGTGQYVELNLPRVCNNQLDRYYIRSDNRTNGIQVYERTPELNLKRAEEGINNLWTISRREVDRVRLEENREKKKSSHNRMSQPDSMGSYEYAKYLMRLVCSKTNNLITLCGE